MRQDAIDQLRAERVPPQSLWIEGNDRAAQSGAAIDVASPVDGKVFTSIAAGGAADIDAAVAAAHGAHGKGIWSRTAPAERKKKLLKLVERTRRIIARHGL